MGAAAESSKGKRKGKGRGSAKVGAHGGYKLEVVITTPETCLAADVANASAAASSEKSGAGAGRVASLGELSRVRWDVVIVDEAHRLKNAASRTACVLRDDFSYLNCVLLTGTPLQNNTTELHTLLNFVDREVFEDSAEFQSEFGDLKSASQLEALHKKIKPYLLRREKDLVEKTVPPKEEVIVQVKLTIPQKMYYRAIYEQKTGFLYRGEKGAKDGPSLSNLAMELRKCCNHPFLVKGAEVEIAKHFAKEGLSNSPLDVMVQSSGKMALLDKLLPKLKADGHRVLIFSQFRIMLNIIEDYLDCKGYSYERVDGSITGRKRQAAIDRYTKSSSASSSSSATPALVTEPPFIMLLSTRAGGVGINLMAADTVIIYDSDWNPQNDVQAQVWNIVY